MDSFFGIGIPELIVILVIAGLVMGPQRIQQVARTLGKWTTQLRQVSRQFTAQLNQELDALDENNELRGAVGEMKNLRREAQQWQNDLRQSARDFVGESKKVIDEGRQAVQDTEATIRPPQNGQPQPLQLPNVLNVPDDPE